MCVSFPRLSFERETKNVTDELLILKCIPGIRSAAAVTVAYRVI